MGRPEHCSEDWKEEMLPIFFQHSLNWILNLPEDEQEVVARHLNPRGWVFLDYFGNVRFNGKRRFHPVERLERYRQSKLYCHIEDPHASDDWNLQPLLNLSKLETPFVRLSED